MKAKDFNNLLYAPSWTSQILHHFLSGACDSKFGKLKFELIYFGLPFVHEEAILEKLSTSNKKSTITSLFDTPGLKNTLILINNKIIAFKKITNQGLIYLGNIQNLEIAAFISINETVKYSEESNLHAKKIFKAAYNWGQILAKEDYKSIFLKFEIENI